MKKQTNYGLWAFIALLCCVLFRFPASAQEAAQPVTNQWSLWFGSHYTGLEDYTLRVAEFDRGEEGFMPEFQLKWLRTQGQNRLNFAGNFYDSKRMSLNLQGNFSNFLSAKVAYKSFYRRNQIDLLQNMVARESGNKEGTVAGGKIITNELLFDPDTEDIGYRRQEIETHLEAKIPGLKNLKVIASHRSIMESGHSQEIQISHCATCHVTSRSIALDRVTHTVAGGVEAAVTNDFIVSYQAQYRQFKSNEGTYEAMFDTARHPVNGSSGDEFASRNIFSGETAQLGLYPETKKLSHRFKAKGVFGKTNLLAQVVSFTAENNNDLPDENVLITGDRETSGTYTHLRLAHPFFPKTKLIAGAYFGTYENSSVLVDLPDWRDNRSGGDIDFDYTRFSNYTRTEMRGNLEFIYQPTSRYRLSLLGEYSTRERDDYPFEGAKDKTTKFLLQGDVKYRPSREFTGHLRYYFENIDNPFSPYNNLFERYGRSGPDSLTPIPGTPAVYYYQRDAIRYGSVTSLPAVVNGGKLDVDYRLTPKTKLSLGLTAKIATNNDTPELEYKQTSMQPTLGFSAVPNDKFSLFTSFSYLYKTQNGIATFAMMDG